MEGWTRFVLRFRWPILIGWLVVLLAGGFASTKLSALLSNTFTVPGTDSERARTILERHYGDRVESYVTGQAAIQHDLDPIFSNDLRKGETIALPIAFAVMLGVFGLSLAVTLPFLFAGCTIMGTLGAVYLFAQHLTMATYVTNLVQLIGLGIAIDYSLLVVYRFREELERVEDENEAIVRTMRTAGRAVVFSGATVAIGLALLLFMPLPFMRMLGVAGFLIPIVSIVAAVTLQPVLLSYYGRRGTARKRILPGDPIDPEHGFWARLARSIMRRPLLYLAFGGSAL